ncbi:hypothetical protein MC885_004458, partial [Smutsia gigantea]
VPVTMRSLRLLRIPFLCGLLWVCCAPRARAEEPGASSYPGSVGLDKNTDGNEQAPPMSEAELINLIDGVLRDDDKNNDGYIDYAEFAKSLQWLGKDVHVMPAKATMPCCPKRGEKVCGGPCPLVEGVH